MPPDWLEGDAYILEDCVPSQSVPKLRVIDIANTDSKKVSLGRVQMKPIVFDKKSPGLVDGEPLVGQQRWAEAIPLPQPMRCILGGKLFGAGPRRP